MAVGDSNSDYLHAGLDRGHLGQNCWNEQNGVLPKAANSCNIFSRFASILLLAMLIILALLLFLSPFYRGLFFTHELLTAQAVIFGLLILWGAFRLILKEVRVLGSPLDLCLLLLFLSYAVSFFSAVNKRSALEEVLKLAAYVAIYLTVAAICRCWPLLRPKKSAGNGGSWQAGVLPAAGGATILLHLLSAAAFIVAVASLGAAAGHWQITGAYQDAGFRIASPMGYANTAAAYLMAAYFLTLSLAPLRDRWWCRVLYLFPAVVMLAAVILTFSRGAWLLLLPFATLLVMLAAPGMRMRTFCYLLVSFIPALPAAFYADPLFRSADPAHGWLPIIAAAVTSFILGTVLEYYSVDKHKLKVAPVAIAIIALIIAGFVLFQPLTKLLPERFYSRIFSAGAVVNYEARIEMYRDALLIIKDYPLLGTGGGGWAALYQGYQGRVYYSTEVHNHFLQVWVEAGLLGFLAFIGIWISLGAAFIYNCFRARAPAVTWQLWTAVCLPVAVLGAHSMIDWNFSLAAVGIYLFVLLGICRGMDNRGWFGKTSAACGYAEEKSIGGRLSGVVALVVGLFLLFYSLVLLNGYLSTLRSQQHLAHGDLMEAVLELGKAIKYDPLRADNYHNLGILFDDQARSSGSITELQQLVYLAQRAYELEPYNPLYVHRYGELLVHFVDVDQGLALIDRVILLRPFEQESYDQARLIRLQLAEYYRGNNNPGQAERMLQEIEEITLLMQLKNKTGN